MMTEMPIERNAVDPLYVQIAEDLRQAILSGHYKPGQSIGSEAELCRRWGVSRTTIRQGLRVLQEEGWIVAHQGKGTFIAHQKAQQVIGRLETLEDSLTRQGLHPKTELLRFAFEPAPPELKDLLELGEGQEVLVLQRQYLVHDEPMAVVTISVPEGIGRRIAREDAEHAALYAILPNKLGLELGMAVQTITASVLDPNAASLLRAAAGTPTLVCERLTYLKAGSPAMLATFLCRGDRFEFRVTLPQMLPSEAMWSVPGLVIRADGGQTNIHRKRWDCRTSTAVLKGGGDNPACL